MDPLDVEADDSHHVVCPKVHCREQFDTYVEYHEHYKAEHIPSHGKE